LLTPLCLFSSWFRWIWLAVMIPFHISTGFLMGIWFPYSMALVPMLLGGFDPFRRSVVAHRAEQPAALRRLAA